MANPLISVVMSVYNAEAYLKEAIESILNQTYKNFEFIIVNDGSTDGSLAIIKEYLRKDKRIILISRDNKGLPFSLNEGIEKAKGKYIVRMDADDTSLPMRLAVQVQFMESNPEIGVCGTWAEIFDRNRGKRILKYPESDAELKTRLLFSVCFVHPTVIIRKQLLEQFNLNYNLNYLNSQDYELWARLQEYTKMANIPSVLLIYRVIDNSITSIANSNQLELRYVLLRGVFEKMLDNLGIANTEIENKLHFTIGLNKRIEKEDINLAFLDSYLTKIINANKKVEYFDKKYLLKFLSRKFLIVAYYQFKRGNYQIGNIVFSKYLYCWLFYFFIKSKK